MGGDGSLGLFLEGLLLNEEIKARLQEIIFVPLPYGTGNDLCRSLGWGGKEGKWAASLDALAQAVLAASEDRLALWNVDIYAEVSMY